MLTAASPSFAPPKKPLTKAQKEKKKKYDAKKQLEHEQEQLEHEQEQLEEKSKEEDENNALAEISKIIKKQKKILKKREKKEKEEEEKDLQQQEEPLDNTENEITKIEEQQQEESLDNTENDITKIEEPQQKRSLFNRIGLFNRICLEFLNIKRTACLVSTFEDPHRNIISEEETVLFDTTIEMIDYALDIHKELVEKNIFLAQWLGVDERITNGMINFLELGKRKLLEGGKITNTQFIKFLQRQKENGSFLNLMVYGATILIDSFHSGEAINKLETEEIKKATEITAETFSKKEDFIRNSKITWFLLDKLKETIDSAHTVTGVVEDIVAKLRLALYKTKDDPMGIWNSDMWDSSIWTPSYCNQDTEKQDMLSQIQIQKKPLQQEDIFMESSISRKNKKGKKNKKQINDDLILEKIQDSQQMQEKDQQKDLTSMMNNLSLEEDIPTTSRSNDENQQKDPTSMMNSISLENMRDSRQMQTQPIQQENISTTSRSNEEEEKIREGDGNAEDHRQNTRSSYNSENSLSDDDQNILESNKKDMKTLMQKAKNFRAKLFEKILEGKEYPSADKTVVSWAKNARSTGRISELFMLKMFKLSHLIEKSDNSSVLSKYRDYPSLIMNIIDNYCKNKLFPSDVQGRHDGQVWKLPQSKSQPLPPLIECSRLEGPIEYCYETSWVPKNKNTQVEKEILSVEQSLRKEFGQGFSLFSQTQQFAKITNVIHAYVEKVDNQNDAFFVNNDIQFRLYLNQKGKFVGFGHIPCAEDRGMPQNGRYKMFWFDEKRPSYPDSNPFYQN